MEIRFLEFSGTKEEFEAVHSLLEAGKGTIVTTAPGDWEPGAPEYADGPPRPFDVDDALEVLRYGGGLSRGQLDVFKLLFEKDREVPSSEFKKKYSWSSARFRGVLANLPRREKGALGYTVPLVQRRWDGEEGQAYYWLDPVAREAFEIEYAST